jgi:hypothetical protein
MYIAALVAVPVKSVSNTAISETSIPFNQYLIPIIENHIPNILAKVDEAVYPVKLISNTTLWQVTY